MRHTWILNRSIDWLIDLIIFLTCVVFCLVITRGCIFAPGFVINYYTILFSLLFQVAVRKASSESIVKIRSLSIHALVYLLNSFSWLLDWLIDWLTCSSLYVLRVTRSSTQSPANCFSNFLRTALSTQLNSILQNTYIRRWLLFVGINV